MDDLELQRLEAVAAAARVEREMIRALPNDAIQELYGLGLPESAMLHLSMALDTLDKGREVPEYDDGPWATGESDSRADNCVGWACDDREGWSYHKEAAGVWHFPGPDVSGKDRGYIQVEAYEQGFLIAWDDKTLAFTDRVDAAEWLLSWLGFEDEIVESVRDILEGLWDADELYNILSGCVAGVDYDELVAGAVSWNDPEQRKPLEYERALDVVGEAWAFIEEVEAGGFGEDGQYQRLVEAVKKWRGIEGG